MEFSVPWTPGLPWNKSSIRNLWNKCLTSRNKCLTSSNKKLVETIIRIKLDYTSPICSKKPSVKPDESGSNLRRQGSSPRLMMHLRAITRACEGRNKELENTFLEAMKVF